MGQDMLFTLGLLFSMASQLRLAGSSVLGPGELCLALWVLVSIGSQLSRVGPALTPALSRMLIFWGLFAVAESLGTLMGAAIHDEHDTQWFLHDILAYVLLASMSCLSVARPDAAMRLRRTGWLLITLGTASLAIQLGAALGLFGIPGVDPWYWDRLRGFAATPNQLSIVCIALFLLSFHLAETAGSPGKKAAAFVCAILPVYVGWQTHSDTFNLVLVVGGPAYIALKLRKWLFAPEWKMSLRSCFAWIIVFALPLIVVMALPLNSMIADEMTVAAKEMSRESSEATEEAAALRFNLWQQAINRGAEAGLLGLGPGPHLSIPSSIVAARQDSKDQPKNIEHPAPGAVPNFEAHNTILDLFVQGGLLADLSFLWLMASTILIGYRAGLDGLTVLVASLFLFGLFHLIIRQPIFWYGICYCLAASGDVGKDVHRLRHALRGQRGTIFSSLA
jgi:hypothetical protein